MYQEGEYNDKKLWLAIQWQKVMVGTYEYTNKLHTLMVCCDAQPPVWEKYWMMRRANAQWSIFTILTRLLCGHLPYIANHHKSSTSCHFETEWLHKFCLITPWPYMKVKVIKLVLNCHQIQTEKKKWFVNAQLQANKKILHTNPPKKVLFWILVKEIKRILGSSNSQVSTK